MSDASLKESSDIKPDFLESWNARKPLPDHFWLGDPWRYKNEPLVEHFLRTYSNVLHVLPRMAQMVDALVEHVEKDPARGKAFVRPEIRPDVGSEVVADMTATLRLLNERVSRLEKAVRK